MSSTSELPVWFVPLFALGFPIAFVTIWCVVCAIVASVSGYRSLARFRIDPSKTDEEELLPSPGYATIGISRYRGRILTLRAGPGGLTLRIPRIFPFHPPVRVPWERIREDANRGILGTSLLLDERVRLGVPAETFAAIRDAKARYAG
jgi:hypothetical protein